MLYQLYGSISLSCHALSGENFTVMFQAQGFKYKSKSLEEIVQTSRKQEGKLIGFDETLSISNAADTLELEKLQIGETSTSVTTHTPCRKPCGNATDKASFRSNITSPLNAHGKETEKDSSHRNSQPTDCEAHGKEPALPSQLAERDCGETSEASNHNSTKKTPGMVLFILDGMQGICF